jgi:hypothetical protein
MKIFVAMPVYDGKLPLETAAALLQEQLFAGQNGHELVFAFLPSCSVPATGRNQLVQAFLDSDCDRLFFLDSDISFPIGSLLKVAHQKEEFGGKLAEFVGGCYRFKMDEENYPIGLIEPLPKPTETGLIEVATMPTGFLAISRSVFEKFMIAYPGRECAHQGNKMYGFFQMVFKDGNMWSEDTYFCKEWRDIGGKVYLDPSIRLTHWEHKYKPYDSHIATWLKGKYGNS